MIYKTRIDDEQVKVTVSRNVDPSVLIKRPEKSKMHAECGGAINMAKKIIEEEILEIKEEIENIDRTIAMYNSRITYYQREVLIEKKCLEDQQETLLMAQSNLKCFDGGRTSSGRGSGGRGSSGRGGGGKSGGGGWSGGRRSSDRGRFNSLIGSDGSGGGGGRSGGGGFEGGGRLRGFGGRGMGLVVQPFIGYYIDHCQSSFDRHRPFILGGVIAVVIAALLIAFASDLGHLFGDTLESETKPHNIVITVLSLSMFEVANNVVQTPCRAFIGDLASDDYNQVIIGNWLVSFFKFAQLLGEFNGLPQSMWMLMLITGISWVAWFLFSLFNTDWMGREE
uniref:SUTp2 n=1 Tax=Medicago truncatula TaxID=3880 RepID=J7FC79_MEDTR|nr:SUTp2 [Medicago truncatula]